MRKQIRWLVILLFAVRLVVLSPVALAQDAREALGPRDGQSKSKEPHPLTELMARLNSTLRPELRGRHPRVYITDEGLRELRERARTTHRDLWRRALEQVRAIGKDPPPAPAQERRAQNDVGIAIAEAALAYKIEGDKKYLEAARKFMDAAVSYDVWGYTYNKPNVDLAAGHLLYGLGWGYDLLYHDLADADRLRYRDKLAKQARLLFDYYKPKPGRTYSYSQNHVFIPMAGLGVASYALYDEVEDAPQWARLARAIYDRMLTTYSADGYYYEGFEYWVFSTPWLIHYLDAHLHATGEDLFDRPGLRQMHLYVGHSMLPDGKYVFDFGDIFEGPLTRARKGADYERSHPSGRFQTNYNLLYRLAARFQSSEAQGVAAWLESLKQDNAEDYWSLLWFDPKLKPLAIERQQPWHYFPDHEVVFWRERWTPDATAFAFKCGPPEGHHTEALLRALQDWHLSSGHAHPDANSFIIYARGQYLTGDTGYAGLPMTDQHNTMLVDGRGQAHEGRGHDVFDEIPYERLDRIRITEARLGRDSVTVRGDATAAYEPELGLTRFERTFRFTHDQGFVVEDDLTSTVPRVFTTLVHADDRVRQTGARRFEIFAGSAGLSVDVVKPQATTIKIEPNLLTGPGAPGSVDKGERQQRGQRLAVSTAKPVNTARFVIRLAVAEAREPIR